MVRLLFSVFAFFTLGASSCAQTDIPIDSDKEVQEGAVLDETPVISEAEHDQHKDEHAEGHDGPDPHHKNSPRPYDAERDGWADLNATQDAAALSGKRAIIVMGANWCHDSRGLAYYFENPEFRAANITPYFEQVYIDVGEKNRNVDIAQSLGVEDIVGTPTVFILSTDGEVLNLDTAPTWRNAASRTEEEIVEYFKSYRN